ncbi:hypothetical protein SAMN05660463_02144 [Pseudomonas sp. URIL14HWK12:I9]|nr:hypothetical protein F474_01943 [Pseudomonas sp. URIL14HWK12:I12]PVZ25721.1 hypothetical protein F470_01167 [Pseudomonas sp. URIL14HWK12:I10]PVZ36755.1 hypothetical protein F472_01943 [Pseudomonas sp. URIL14HWK12:I11]SNZ12678.1 hypothetical protein SAMN05660463_02144 [Pseudomonas sp. URIL14HWK12:I9]
MQMARTTWLLEPPSVPEALADLPGGDPGVLPQHLIDEPLRVVVPIWEVSNPSPFNPALVEVYWHGILADTKTFTAPLDPDRDLVFLIPPDIRLKHGTFDVTYSVRIAAGDTVHSTSRQITVDLFPPAFTSAGRVLIFDVASVTDDYLQANGDVLMARLPAYRTPSPGDEVVWYWDSTPSAGRQAGQARVADLVPPGKVSFSGQLLRDAGEGTRYAQFVLKDYAGNEVWSGVAELDSRPLPVPRVLPALSVLNASGAGMSQSLTALSAFNQGVTLKVPDNAVLKPGDRGVIRWGEAGQPGFREQPFGQAGETWVVPPDSVAPFLDNQVALSYRVIDVQFREYHAAPGQLRLTQAASLINRSVQCDLVEAGALSLRAALDRGAVVKLAPWSLMQPGQTLKFVVSGVSANLQPVNHTFAEGWVVTQEQCVYGVGFDDDPCLHIPAQALQSLRINEVFQVDAYLSFNGSGQWAATPTFKKLQATLRR